MHQDKRIVLNVIASYARSVYSICVGLVAGRWTLQSLGTVDYGLMGVIGSLTAFVTFLNNLMSSAVGRFYAYHIGATQVTENKQKGIEQCRMWFNSALLIHTIFPVISLLIGYPLGCWAIGNYLTIPADRLEDCLWGWRFVCCSCFISMINVPFQAMYTAKQEIAELTIYSFFTSTLNACFLYYMITHPGIWLARYMAWTCLLVVLPQLIICIRAVVKYPECRFVWKYLWNADRLKEVFSYAGGRMFCVFTQVLTSQGSDILINKVLGPLRNAAMSVGNTINGHSLTLSNAFVGALAPAITNAAGAGDFGRMTRLMTATCAAASSAALIFALPLIVESKTVIDLWLKEPPLGSDRICVLILVASIITRASDGLWMGIFAMGKVVKFQLFESLAWIIVLPTAFLLMKCEFDIFGVGYALILAQVLAVIVKLYFARKFCAYGVMNWMKRIMMPVVEISGICFAVGYIPRMIMPPSFMRIVLTTCLIELSFLPLAWRFMLPIEVKVRLRDKFTLWGRKAAHGR